MPSDLKYIDCKTYDGRTQNTIRQKIDNPCPYFYQRSILQLSYQIYEMHQLKNFVCRHKTRTPFYDTESTTPFRRHPILRQGHFYESTITTTPEYTTP